MNYLCFFVFAVAAAFESDESNDGNVYYCTGKSLYIIKIKEL